MRATTGVIVVATAGAFLGTIIVTKNPKQLVFAEGERILMPLGEPYRPWRTAATWYMWRALEMEMP